MSKRQPKRPRYDRVAEEREVRRRAALSRRRKRVPLKQRSYRSEIRDYLYICEAAAQSLESDLANSGKHLRRAESLEAEAEALLLKAAALRERHESLSTQRESHQAELKGYRIKIAACQSILALPSHLAQVVTQLPPKFAVRYWLCITTGDKEQAEQIYRDYLERRS